MCAQRRQSLQEKTIQVYYRKRKKEVSCVEHSQDYKAATSVTGYVCCLFIKTDHHQHLMNRTLGQAPSVLQILSKSVIPNITVLDECVFCELHHIFLCLKSKATFSCFLAVAVSDLRSSRNYRRLDCGSVIFRYLHRAACCVLELCTLSSFIAA